MLISENDDFVTKDRPVPVSNEAIVKLNRTSAKKGKKKKKKARKPCPLD
jgi:hypothetical protein